MKYIVVFFFFKYRLIKTYLRWSTLLSSFFFKYRKYCLRDNCWRNEFLETYFRKHTIFIVRTWVYAVCCFVVCCCGWRVEKSQTSTYNVLRINNEQRDMRHMYEKFGVRDERSTSPQYTDTSHIFHVLHQQGRYRRCRQARICNNTKYTALHTLCYTWDIPGIHVTVRYSIY